MIWENDFWLLVYTAEEEPTETSIKGCVAYL